MTGAKDEDNGEGGEFIDAGDKKDQEEVQESLAKPVGLGSEAVFATEDGGKVTATVSTFDDLEDDEPMPGLIPVSKSTTSSLSGGAIPKKPKLKGNTSAVNISSSLKSKKRKNDHQRDRKGFNKKSKH